MRRRAGALARPQRRVLARLQRALSLLALLVPAAAFRPEVLLRQLVVLPHACAVPAAARAETAAA